MGLVDLHRHLDGSLRPDTLRELSEAAGHALHAVPRFLPGMGLEAALDCFRVTLAAMQTPDAVARVMAEACEDAAAEGVTHLEIRFAPHLHAGAPLDDIVDAAVEGVAGRAGIILCGLYGNHPQIFDALVDLAGPRLDVVGIDLAGGPLPDHRYGLRDYADAYAGAAALGLGRTVHAGEGRPASEIRDAIEILGAQRIGHALSITDDPEVVELAISRGVTLEACPTSNWHVGILSRPDAHPACAWLDRGLRVAICTDNPLLSQTTLREEFSRIGVDPGSGLGAAFTRNAQHGLFSYR